MFPARRFKVGRLCRQIAEVDEQCFDDPMPIFRIREHITGRYSRAFTALNDAEPMGFLLYTRFRRSIRIDRIAVIPKYRRMRVASGMLSNLTLDLHPEIDRFTAYVREDNMDALRFFRFFGFVSCPPYLTIRDDSGLDFVKMVHRPD